ncbi:MAG: radical SAM protein [Proteobacteria bacterium]|nr:radical SAM protein [Pseudomonadota bacterium]MBU1596534.1 radical SAM protein [Pseudomonadota bacterium]
MTLLGHELEGQVIRPPAEAESILLQVTLGCSHNKCAFCPAYKGKRFAIKSPQRIQAALDHAAAHLPEARRLFLCDGDALILPQDRLEGLLRDIRQRLPQVARVSAYANAKALARKTGAELARLRGLGLSTLYLGLESGSDAVLADMGKWGDVDEHLRQAAKARQAGMKLSVTVLLGLGGRGLARQHAEATGRALSRMDPEQAAALALMIVPGTPLHERLERGEFEPQDDQGLLQELYWLLEALDLSSGLFFSNHASNPLRLRLRLPRDKQAGLAQVRAALEGRAPLVPWAYRRL